MGPSEVGLLVWPEEAPRAVLAGPREVHASLGAGEGAASCSCYTGVRTLGEATCEPGNTGGAPSHVSLVKRQPSSGTPHILGGAPIISKQDSTRPSEQDSTSELPLAGFDQQQQ